MCEGKCPSESLQSFFGVCPAGPRVYSPQKMLMWEHSSVGGCWHFYEKIKKTIQKSQYESFATQVETSDEDVKRVFGDKSRHQSHVLCTKTHGLRVVPVWKANSSSFRGGLGRKGPPFFLLYENKCNLGYMKDLLLS